MGEIGFDAPQSPQVDQHAVFEHGSLMEDKNVLCMSHGWPIDATEATHGSAGAASLARISHSG
jgi:hypothetical protein